MYVTAFSGVALYIPFTSVWGTPHRSSWERGSAACTFSDSPGDMAIIAIIVMVVLGLIALFHYISVGRHHRSTPDSRWCVPLYVHDYLYRALRMQAALQTATNRCTGRQ